MTELEKQKQYKTQLLNVIKIKREELQDLENSLKAVNEDIYNINESKQMELPL